MTLINKKKIYKILSKEKEVLEYLSDNPDIISKNIVFFNKIFSLKSSKDNIISFENIRINSLIKENNFLKQKLIEIIKLAKDYKKIQDKLSKFSHQIILINDINSLIKYTEDFIRKEFLSIEANFYFIKFNRFFDLNKKYFLYDKKVVSLIKYVFLKKRSILATKNIIEKYSIEKFVKSTKQLVLCPLGVSKPSGIIFINYKSEMEEVDLQFDLLNLLSETISYSLEEYTQNNE